MDLLDQSAVSLTNILDSHDVLKRLGIDTRNPLFGAYELVRRLNPACLATKTSLNFEKKKYVCDESSYHNYNKANNKGADQTAQMRSLVCASVIRMQENQDFSRQGLYHIK